MDNAVSQLINPLLSNIAPNTSRLVYEEYPKLKKTKFYKTVSGMFKKTDTGEEDQPFHKSSRDTISKSLSGINENDINKAMNDDEPLFKNSTKGGNSEPAGKTEPYFANSSAKGSSRGNKGGLKVITNNYYATSNKNTAVTNKILLNHMKASLELQRNSTSAILGNISAIHQFQQEVTVDFYNDVSDKLAHIGNSIDQISRLYVENQDNLFKTERDNLVSTIKANGMMFSTFGEIFSQNLANGDLLKGVLGSNKKLDIGDMIKEKISSGNKNKKGALDSLLGNVRALDEMVGGLPANLLMSLNSMRRNGSNMKVKMFGKQIDLGKLAGNAFGMDTKVDTRMSTNKFNKGPMAYNGIANRAIVNVIPGLLSKILATLNNREELIYDYDSGKFTDKSRVQEERNRRLRGTVKENMSGDIAGILGTNASKKDRDLLEQVLYNMAMEGKTASDYKGSITGNKDLDKKLNDYLKNSRNRNRFNKNIFNTNMSMNEFFSEFAQSDIAGQMAMDYGTDIYGEARSASRRRISRNVDQYRNTKSNSLSSKFDDLFNKLDNVISKTSEATESGKNVQPGAGASSNGSIYYHEQDYGSSNAKFKNNSVIDYLKTMSENNAFRVVLKGGFLDNIKSTVVTDEKEEINRNASFEANRRKELAEEEETAKDKAQDSQVMGGLAAEQNERISAFKVRRDALLDEMEAGFNKLLDATGINDKIGQAKLGLHNKFVNSRLGKTKVGKVIGKLFTTPNQVEEAGMTPVYVMGSAVEGMITGTDIGDTVQDIKQMDFSGLKNLLGKGQGLLGNLLGKGSNLLGKLSGKGGRIGRLASKASGLLGRGSKALTSAGSRNMARAALESGDSNMIDALMEQGYSEDDILNMADSDSLTKKGTGKLKDFASKAKGKATNLGGKALSKGGSLLGKAGGKLAGLASKGGKLGSIASKAGGLLTSLGGKAAGAGASMLGSAGTSLAGMAGSAGTALAGAASTAGSAIAGIGASVGPALAGLAPILGPVAVAGLATAAVVKFGPKIANGIKNLAGKAVDGIKNLGNKVKETGKNLVKGAGKVAKGAVTLGAKMIEYSPLGLAVKGITGIKNFFTGGDKDKEKEDKKKKSETNPTSGDGLGDIDSESTESTASPTKLSDEELSNLKISKKGINVLNPVKNFLNGKKVNPNVSKASYFKEGEEGNETGFIGTLGKIAKFSASLTPTGLALRALKTKKENETVSSQKLLTIKEAKEKGNIIEFPLYREICIELIS